MTTTAKPLYGSSAALTMTLASLATSSSLVAGRESTAINNNTDLAIDALVGGKVTVGTTPTANTQIEVWAIGSYDGTSYSGGATGSDANLSFSTTNSKSLLKLLAIIPVLTSTSNITFAWGPFSIAQAFGGVMPQKWSIFIVHNTGVNLHATAGNHEVKYTPVQYQSV